MCFERNLLVLKECWPETRPKPFSFHPEGWGLVSIGDEIGCSGTCPGSWSLPPHHKPFLWPDPGGLHLWVSARPHWVPGCCADSVVPSWQKGCSQGIWSWCSQASPCSGALSTRRSFVCRGHLTLGENSWAGRRNPPTTMHLGDFSSYRQDFWNHTSFLRPLRTPLLLVSPNFCLFECEFSLCFVN